MARPPGEWDEVSAARRPIARRRVWLGGAETGSGSRFPTLHSMEPMVMGASLAWYLVKLAVRIRGLDDGGDPADAMGDISELTAKLSDAGRRT